MLFTNDPVVAGRAAQMIPGRRDSGALTRFAAGPEAIRSVGGVTMDAATIADRQLEGGGAARERRPVRVARWTAFIQRMSAIWRPSRISQTPSSAREPVAMAPNLPGVVVHTQRKAVAGVDAKSG